MDKMLLQLYMHVCVVATSVIVDKIFKMALDTGLITCNCQIFMSMFPHYHKDTRSIFLSAAITIN